MNGNSEISSSSSDENTPFTLHKEVKNKYAEDQATLAGKTILKPLYFFRTL